MYHCMATTPVGHLDSSPPQEQCEQTLMLSNSHRICTSLRQMMDSCIKILILNQSIKHGCRTLIFKRF